MSDRIAPFNMEELLPKLHRAVVLTDRELLAIHQHYNALDRGFAMAGYCQPEYRLIRNDIRKNVEKARDMLIARALY